MILFFFVPCCMLSYTNFPISSFMIPEPTARSAVPGVSLGRGLLIPHDIYTRGNENTPKCKVYQCLQAHHFGSWVDHPVNWDHLAIDLTDLKIMANRQERKGQRFKKKTRTKDYTRRRKVFSTFL